MKTTIAPAEVSINKLDPSRIEVYNVLGAEDEYTPQHEGVVVRWMTPDGRQSFQCITCRTENSSNFSPCAHIAALKGQLGVRSVVDDYLALVRS